MFRLQVDSPTRSEMFRLCVGISKSPLKFSSARKIWPFLDLLQKMDECSLTRARKIFAIARMLGFSITRNFVNRDM